LLLPVVKAAIARALIDGAVRALFPAVEGAVTVRTPVRGLGRTMAASELRQAATDFAVQLASLPTIVEVEEGRRCAAVGTTSGGRRPASAPTPNRRQRPTPVSVMLSTQLLPVESRRGRRESGRLGQGRQRIDVEIAIVRMLLAKVVARLRLGLTPGENLFEFVEELLQVLAGKLPAEPKYQSWYLAHGGESLGNLAGSLQRDFGKRDSTAVLLLRSSPNPQPGSAPQACKIQRSSPEAGGESTNPSFPQPFNELLA